MQRFLIAFAGLAGALSVALSAVSTHWLPARLDPAALGQFRNAVQIGLWHALALLAIALWLPRGGMAATAAGALVVAGTVAFCGAVWLLTLGGIRIPYAAPAGGMMLIAGWLALAVSAFTRS